MASLAATVERRVEVPGSSNVAADKLSIALQVAAALLWLPQAALISIVIGDIAGAGRSDQAGWFAAGVAAIGILKAGLEGVGIRIAFRVAREVVSDTRRRVAASLAGRSPIDVDRPASGRAASAMAEQAEMIVPYLARFEIARAKAVVIPVVLFLFILSLSWAAAIVLLFAAPLIPIFMALIGWRAQEASEAQLVKAGDMNAFLLDRLRGLTTIRSLNAVDLTARRLRADAESLRTRTMAVLRIAFLSSAVLELFSALGVAMVAVYVGFHLLGQLRFGTWGAPLDLSEGMFILLLAPAFFDPLRDLSAVWHDRASGRAALDMLDHLSVDGIRLVGDDQNEKPGHFSGGPPQVLVEGLSYRNTGVGTSTFDDFVLSVAPGEHVALVGPSGSGKSTLLALLAGLCPPTAGHISIGGHQLTNESAAALRRCMAWIGQRPHVFTGTLATNVTLGRAIDRGTIAKALRFAKLDQVARVRGSDAIGESGVGLSGGETLRLALARIAADPNVGLILADEPTAHLDAETAHIIADDLIALARGKTLIVATHEARLAARMDRIVHLRGFALEEAA